MDACAAGLPRVSDSPRNTKSDVPPRLPVTTLEESACAAAHESSATGNSHLRKNRGMIGITVGDSLRAIHVRRQSDESSTGWQAPESVTPFEPRRSRVRADALRAWPRRGCDCDPGPQKPLLTTSRSMP